MQNVLQNTAFVESFRGNARNVTILNRILKGKLKSLLLIVSLLLLRIPPDLALRFEF